MRRELEELKLENRECQDAWNSLQELQNEFMHLGSLAFAIEGQVKEKSRWFSSLRDKTRKLKLMKVEYITLSDEAFAYKKCLADMKSTIQSTMKKQIDLHEAQLSLSPHADVLASFQSAAASPAPSPAKQHNRIF